MINEPTACWFSFSILVQVHVKRLSANVIWSVYLPLWLSGLISLTTIFVGYGDGLVSAFGDRASIAVTLMLTVVAWETPASLRTIKRVQNLKTWTFFLVTIVIIKDVVFTMYWWHTLYWKSEDIADKKPVGASQTNLRFLYSLSSRLSHSFSRHSLDTTADTIHKQEGAFLRSFVEDGSSMSEWRRLWRADAFVTMGLLVGWIGYFQYLIVGVRYNGKLGPLRTLKWIWRKVARAEERWEKDEEVLRILRHARKFGLQSNDPQQHRMVKQPRELKEFITDIAATNLHNVR